MAKYRKLGRRSDLRKALLRNQVTALLNHGRIRTTEAKAKEIRKIAEDGMKKAPKEVDLVEKLFTEIAPKYEGRNGGYTRIVKIGQRKGDAAMEVFIELV